MKAKRIQKLLLIATPIVIATVFVYGYLLTLKDNPSQDQQQENTAITDQKSQQEQPKNTSVSTTTTTTTTSTTDSTNNSKQVFLYNITADNLRVYFGNSLVGISSGECKLFITQNGSSKKEIVGKVELITSYYSCGGMTVLKKELEKGPLKATIKVTADNQSISSAEVSYENK